MIVAVCCAVAMLAAVPIEVAATERVDLIEVNHFYDEHGQRVFDQALFYRWSKVDARHQVVAWRLIKSEDQLPLYDARRGEHAATWRDGETLRRIWSPIVRRSWTQYDPELVERDYLPKEERTELLRPTRPAGATGGSDFDQAQGPQLEGEP